MSSNLPPGVSASDIPGNRPEDVEFENFYDWLLNKGFDVPELKEIFEVGFVVVHTFTKSIQELRKEIREDLQEITQSLESKIDDNYEKVNGKLSNNYHNLSRDIQDVKNDVKDCERDIKNLERR